MANTSPAGAPPTRKQTLLIALALGIAAGGCGGALGYMLGGQAVSSGEETATQAQDSSSVSQTEAPHTVRSETVVTREAKNQRSGRAHGTENAGEKKLEGSHTPGRSNPTSSKLTVKELSPIVTNLAEPATNWIRPQSAIVFNPEELPHPEKIIAELTSDITGYLRTISLSHLEGADGLRRLQEELSERAAIRSNGKIHEFIVETMVVQ